MGAITTLGSLLGLAFLSGMRLYSTVFAVGLGVRFNYVKLPASLEHLSVLASTPVLIIAGAIYVIEFLADKIPWVDSLWDLFHTFIRPLGAAVLGAVAIGNVDPVVQIGAFMLCGGVAFASHAAKSGTRIAANHSPEPASNIGLSLLEDGVVVAGAWFAFNHPIATLIIVLSLVAVIAWLVPKIFRLVRRNFDRIKSFGKNEIVS